MNSTFSQLYMLGMLGVAICFVLGGIAYLSHCYTLDGIKNKTVGDGQYGTARFATQKEINETYKKVLYDPKAWRKGKDLPDCPGVVLGFEQHGNKRYALVDTDDIHAMMIGTAGVGKTTKFLYPNIELACASGVSFLTTDTKGDLFRNYATIAKKYYGYQIAVIDLRNPTKSDGYNLMGMVNKYMDQYIANPKDLRAKAKAEKYAKIISKTIIDSDGADHGQNAFFYDSAAGLLTSTILLVAEFCKPEERHIISVFKLIQDLLAKDGKSNKSEFKVLLEKLPETHKTRWFAGAALNSAEASMNSILSTALSRLNEFLDSELEQILCFDTTVDAESFCAQKSAIFIVMPEEDTTKYFLVSLYLQQLYRELLAIADENNGTLRKRVLWFCDEFGTFPKIESAQMMFSASRSRKLSIIILIQSLFQLEQNYGKEGAAIIQDNCQDTIFGGFTPTSIMAKTMSENLDNRTVLSGSISRGKQDPSQSLQMIQRPLLTADELKVMPKGTFVIMKTGVHPMISKMYFFFDLGILFEEPYEIEEKAQREVLYAGKAEVEANITRKYGTKEDDYILKIKKMIDASNEAPL